MYLFIYTGFPIARSSIELTVWLRTTLKFISFSPYLPSTGITGASYLAWFVLCWGY